MASVDKSLNSANGNPGALVGASGANVQSKLSMLQEYLESDRSAMSLYAKDAHKRVCRMLGYALTLDDLVIWNQTSAILAHRLTSMELASVAYAVLSALEPETREAVYGAAQWGIA